MLKTRAARLLALGDAEERWEATVLLRDAARREIEALEARALPSPAEDVRARVEACSLFLAAKDPLRARAQWALLPREAFSPREDVTSPPVAPIQGSYGALQANFARAWRMVLGPSPGVSLLEIQADQVRALLDGYPGVPELWWALARCAPGSGEAHIARLRALRLEPAFAEDSRALAAWHAIDSAIVFRFAIELSVERKTGQRPSLSVAGRVFTTFADLLSTFAEKTTDVAPDLAIAGAMVPEGATGPLRVEVLGDGLHRFALEDLARDIVEPLGRSDARARLSLFSLLQEHHLRLVATPVEPPHQAGLVIDEARRKSLLEIASAAAQRTVDSRDIPQADDVERVFRTVERIAKGKGDLTDISPRQISYYRRAAKLLGLLTESEEPTGAGLRIVRLDREERLRAALVHFECSSCGDAWLRWSNARSLREVDPSTAVDFLRTSVPGLSKDTCERRAQTLVAWHRALLGAPPSREKASSSKGPAPR